MCFDPRLLCLLQVETRPLIAGDPGARKFVAVKVAVDPEVSVKALDGATRPISAFAGKHVSVALRLGACHDRGKNVSCCTLSVVEGTEVKKDKKVCTCVVRCSTVLLV